ncbi:Transmembrane E3 ubiquitin-protein ligase 1 [Gracilariopsis chorda]|uniref:RING-type E3 ubiquitin transferase n=1 Tax=Gracilariopsis chorda TaxID=448386 RepID=A0A2V3IX34_9FLOR|nr:Transmembrane E3 ubiquitin-protein ligase 1 [Gracilariopsis chorda]|eukprot:PXF46702.1 Transmembrane E3 ubiquitin-protein ligase 1 [Gracilariopsis chorda]
MRFFVFALFSFWVPRIVLNAVEDHRLPLLPWYIIGTTVTRLAIPLYFWGCPYNFLHVQPQPALAIALVVWLSTQATILLSQYKFGSCWFIPKELLPEKYAYSRPIVVDDDSADLEAGASEDEMETRFPQWKRRAEDAQECFVRNR